VGGPRTAVIYDGACPLCRGSVEWIRTRDRAGAFAFVPFQDPGFAERFPQVPLPACEQAVTLVLPDGSAVYVPNEVDGTVSVIDPATRSVTATVDVGAGPRQPVALPDSSAIIVPNSDDGTVMVIGRH
jgi:YVTN family beta-propeller protein